MLLNRPLKRMLTLSVCLCLTGAAFINAASARTDAIPLPKPASYAASDATVDLAQIDISALRLSERDIGLYRKIFSAMARGDKATAKSLSNSLNDKSLLGWTGLRRQPILTSAVSPEQTTLNYISPLPRDAKQVKAAALVKDRVTLHIRADRLDWAKDSIDVALKNGVIDRIEAAQLNTTLAASHLYMGDDQEALRLAHFALQVAGQRTPEAGWIAGLASWRMKDYTRAAQYFAWAPRSPYAGPWLRSAAAYWTARALTKTGHYQQVSAWLMEAAKNPRSFYGLIATRSLGAKFDFNWAIAPFNERHQAILKSQPGAVRALKLAQISQLDAARAELSLTQAEMRPDLREALAALAVAALKPDLAMQVADMLQHPLGGPLDIALYPVSPWHPKDGYRVEPALINAFIRQESRFKPVAKNKGSGAAGLMQIMPRTAKSIDRTAARQLADPETSITLGQKYLEDLLSMTDGNLFEAAIAYNAGPGRLSEWKDRFADVNDPLLFIELIPYGETRSYVERVMANYWIYSLRLGADKTGGVATLDAVASGRVAQYAYAGNRDSTDIVMGAAASADMASAR
ncbi:MAG TPA: lytic transglycosylase domain-containing protein [Alphaproteobacteria bacterium]